MSVFNPTTAIVWAKFVSQAVAMYNSGLMNPAQPPDFPSGWKLVRNITAEAVAGFFLQKQLIGFVAESTETPNRFATVFHGSEGVADFLDDFEFVLTDFRLIPDGGKTEYGFTRFYESCSFTDPISGKSETLREYLAHLSQMITLPPQVTAPPPLMTTPSSQVTAIPSRATPSYQMSAPPSFTVVGHSLGAALATLHAVVLASQGVDVDTYTFASPMVGDTTFVGTYNKLVKNSHRIVNKPDIVPQLPGRLLGYHHVSELYEVNSLDFPEIKHSIGCYHYLTTYLYILGDTEADLGSCKVQG